MSDTRTTLLPAASLPAVGRSPNRAVAYLVGVGYLLAGVVGGAVALGSGMAPGGSGQAHGSDLVRLSLYLLLGVVLVVAAGRGWARAANTAVGVAYLVACVPLLATGACSPPLQLNHPDGLIHLSTAALLLGFGRTQD